MNSHTDSSSHLEASPPSFYPETVAPTPMLSSTIACDPANGVHAPDCTCAEMRVRLNRGH